MRVTTVVALITCATSGASGPAVAQVPSTDSSAVAETVRRFHDALARRDSAAVLALLADDAVVLESGRIESRSEYRAHHLVADMQFAAAVRARRDLLHVVLAGDVAWVTSTSETTGTLEGRAISNVSAELMVLTRGTDGWRIRAIHWSSRRRPSP